MLFLFPDFPFCKPLISSPLPCFYKVAPIPNYPLQPHHTSIPLSWGFGPLQDQRPCLPLMSDKAILCYICMGFSMCTLWLVVYFLGALGALVD